MEMKEIMEQKKQFLSLLLLADEQEDMIDRYLERGTMYAGYDGELSCVCVVTEEAERLLEIKNIAVVPEKQKKGYGKEMIAFLVMRYQEDYDWMQVGTGDSPLTIPFYEKCGFRYSHRIKDFFITEYDHPIYECGKRLTDMVYLKRSLK